MPEKGHGGGRRSSEATIEGRCNDIFGLVVDGQSFRTIRAYVAESGQVRWRVEDRALRRYIARCTARFAELSKVNQAAVKGQAVARLERLYAQATAKGDLRNALAVQQEIGRLHGLNAPTRAELSGPGGAPLNLTIDDLAARFDELVREQAERLES